MHTSLIAGLSVNGKTAAMFLHAWWQSVANGSKGEGKGMFSGLCSTRELDKTAGE
ncbi:hypothetical protein BSS2_I0810 [Brucella suis bv. 1 str. S2]|uniref:Uncharacterized protein n=5 Tax=Brucella TaxID=234 RepID=A9MAK6_BRUC2|nr:hypothetical protein BR0829 [Brucella suis 1330]ABX61909.1 Hypothetical protein, conserved [Brucella canis ATCC 23365]AEU05843.1 hypothetical protein BSVBI22_A0825 [Brucella suis VBI22]AHN46467.1 hypothetical protein BSS2_I0810 [Brucella suis bv. 1 str. S2]EEY32487.1 predicted protein [Brucella suis bv. 3 str. 686]CDL76232.1 unnamed protein product [Brucella canis str. Oliveri]